MNISEMHTQIAENEIKVYLSAANKSAPYIGENGNWYVWSLDAGTHIDSKIRATGEKGDTPTPDVSGETPELLAGNTIYDLGIQSTLTLNLPSGKISDFIQVDFLSADTPTSLTITSASGLSEYDLVPRDNMIYSLYFDWGVLYYDETASAYVYGWRFAYAEYVASEV